MSKICIFPLSQPPSPPPRHSFGRGNQARPNGDCKQEMPTRSPPHRDRDGRCPSAEPSTNGHLRHYVSSSDVHSAPKRGTSSALSQSLTLHVAFKMRLFAMQMPHRGNRTPMSDCITIFDRTSFPHGGQRETEVVQGLRSGRAAGQSLHRLFNLISDQSRSGRGNGGSRVSIAPITERSSPEKKRRICAASRARTNADAENASVAVLQWLWFWRRRGSTCVVATTLSGCAPPLHLNPCDVSSAFVRASVAGNYCS